MTNIDKISARMIYNVGHENAKKTESLNDKQVKSENNNVVADTGFLGKSQVTKPDSINNDIEFCKKHTPAYMQTCDEFFENALKQFTSQGDKNPYEKACMLLKEFANEF